MTAERSLASLVALASRPDALFTLRLDVNPYYVEVTFKQPGRRGSTERVKGDALEPVLRELLERLRMFHDLPLEDPRG